MNVIIWKEILFIKFLLRVKMICIFRKKKKKKKKKRVLFFLRSRNAYPFPPQFINSPMHPTINATQDNNI